MSTYTPPLKQTHTHTHTSTRTQGKNTPFKRKKLQSHTKLWDNVGLFHSSIYCNTLQHTATHCNTLQHTAAHCSSLIQNYETMWVCFIAPFTATHCNTLQHTATHCSTLQQTHTKLWDDVGLFHSSISWSLFRISLIHICLFCMEETHSV